MPPKANLYFYLRLEAMSILLDERPIVRGEVVRLRISPHSPCQKCFHVLEPLGPRGQQADCG